MNLKDIRKDLPPSPATSKGRMKKPRAGIRSTTKNDELVEEIEEDMHPKDGVSCSEKVEITNNIFLHCSSSRQGEGHSIH